MFLLVLTHHEYVVHIYGCSLIEFSFQYVVYVSLEGSWRVY
jgi:hypothetical protein